MQLLVILSEVEGVSFEAIANYKCIDIMVCIQLKLLLPILVNHNILSIGFHDCSLSLDLFCIF